MRPNSVVPSSTFDTSTQTRGRSASESMASRFRRSETELVIIITPYLVKPSNGPLPLPTDGYKVATDAARVFMGKSFVSAPSEGRPVPTLAPSQTQAAPAGTPVGEAVPVPQAPAAQTKGKKLADAAPAPGFSIQQ